MGLSDIYTNMLGKSVLWPAVGNHDTAQTAPTSWTPIPLLRYFLLLPKNGEAGEVASGTSITTRSTMPTSTSSALDSMTGGARRTAPCISDLRTTSCQYHCRLDHRLLASSADTRFRTAGPRGRIDAMAGFLLPVLEQGGWIWF